jgi:hypothetical protein
MNRHILLLLLLSVLLGSCAVHREPPDIAGRAESGDVAARQYPAFFPDGKWQFVHSIGFQTAEGGGTAIGVLALDREEIRCVLTTVEGLILFQAQWQEGGPVAVSRAVAPFDKQEFAEGLMDDVRMIFRKPAGKEQRGRLPSGAPVFRYSAAGQVTDLLPEQDGCWSMQTYGDRERTVRTRACKTVAAVIVPEDIEVISGGSSGYSLAMHLISAEKL